jgi:uncharacterized protein YcgI (DUF1989 family)
LEVHISTLKRLEPQTGCALIVRAGEALEIVSPEDEQVPIWLFTCALTRASTSPPVAL